MKTLQRVARIPRKWTVPSTRVLRAATVLSTVVPVYGLFRLVTGLFHRILPARLLSAVPDLVSDVHTTHAIASGAILFYLGLRLIRRQRFSYYVSLGVLFASAVSGLIIGVTPWFWGSGFAVFAALIPLRGAFTRRARVAPTPGQIVGVAAVLLALAYGVIGAYLLREHFTNLHTWGDAIYFAVTTLRDHVVVCFYTQVGQSVASQLVASRQEFLVVEPDEPTAEALAAEGHRVLQGDPTEESVLMKANLDEARAVIACSDRDADNALITLIAHDVKTSGRNPRLRIVARIEQEQGVQKLEAAGADYVVSPSTLGGRMMGRFAAGESKEDLLRERSDELLGFDAQASDGGD